MKSDPLTRAQYVTIWSYLNAGATSGIGFEVAIQLAKKGAKIIMGCRNLAKGEITKKRIETRVLPDRIADVTILELDLACLKSISRFVSNVEDLTSCVHILGIIKNLDLVFGLVISKVSGRFCGICS